MTLDLKTWATERHRIATDVVAFTDGMTEESVHERATNQSQSSIPLRAAGHSQGGGIHDEVGEPQAHGAFFTKDSSKVGSIVPRSRSVSFTSNTINGRPAMFSDSCALLRL